MKLKADNKVLTKNQPSTVLTATVAAAGTTLTVKNNEGFELNDYVLIGNTGDEKAEIKLITGAVTAGTSLTVNAVTFAHDIDEPVTKIDYDSIEFYNGSTTTASASSAITCSGQSASTFPIDPSGKFTYCEDDTNTTGYGFIRFVDTRPTPDTYSVYSDAIPYTGYTDKMLRSIRKKVRRLLREPDESVIEDDEIDDEINLAQKEVAHDRLWSFYEQTKSFSSVADQYEYSLASDVYKLFEAKYDTQPLAVIDLRKWNMYRWDTDRTGDPTHITMWRNEARVYPYPSSAADTTTLNGAHSAAVTTITVADASEFPEQGRVLIDSEVISYTGTTATTLTGASRGEEGTTAASHTTGTTVTERDFIYHFQEEPADLDDETDETEIPEPSVLAYRAAMELCDPDNERLHNKLAAKYERAMSQLRKVDGPIATGIPLRVKLSEEVITDLGVYRDPNRYPQDVGT